MSVDYSSLVSSVSFTTAITALLAVFAAIGAFYVGTKAGELILSAISCRDYDPYESSSDREYTDEELLCMSDEEFDEWERNHPDD